MYVWRPRTTWWIASFAAASPGALAAYPEAAFAFSDPVELIGETGAIRHFPLHLNDRPRVRLARVPRIADVLDGLAQMESRYLEDAKSRGVVLARKFRSTLLLERAGAFYRNDQFVAAALLVARSLLAFPFRNRVFYARLLRHLLRLVAREGAIDPDTNRSVVHAIPDLDGGGAE